MHRNVTFSRRPGLPRRRMGRNRAGDGMRFPRRPACGRPLPLPRCRPVTCRVPCRRAAGSCAAGRRPPGRRAPGPWAPAPWAPGRWAPGRWAPGRWAPGRWITGRWAPGARLVLSGLRAPSRPCLPAPGPADRPGLRGPPAVPGRCPARGRPPPSWPRSLSVTERIREHWALPATWQARGRPGRCAG